MRSSKYLGALLILFVCCHCQQGKTVHKLTVDADSLIILSLSLQKQISSPEVQRFHEFQAEIDNDFTMLTGIQDKHQNDILMQYKKLQVGLGRCIQLCVHYHEEAFLLENTLREIREKSESENPDFAGLQKMLDDEKGIYINLAMRIDSSLKTANVQARKYYSLKPEIDKIIDRLKQSSYPVP